MLLVLLLIAGLVGAISWFNLATVAVHARTASDLGWDFAAYHVAAKTFISGGDIYQVPFNRLMSNGLFAAYFVYPPPAIFLFVPFAYFSFWQGYVMITAVYVVALLFSVFLIIKILRYYNVHVSTLTLLLICISLFLFEPVVNTMKEGNVNLVILFLITLFYYLLFVRKKAGLAGAALGLAAIIKVWPAILVLLGLLHERSKKLIVTTIATIAALCAVSLWLQGISTYSEFIAVFVNHQQNQFVLSKEAILAPVSWDFNISITATIVKVITLLNLNVGAALVILTVVKVVFIVMVRLYLFKVSKIKKDATKLKEWEILSFTALLVSILLISNFIEAYYTTFFVLSFILIIFVIPLTLIEKAALWLSLALFATRAAVLSLLWWIGGGAKIVAYVIEPQIVAYMLFTIVVFYVIKDRAQRGYWRTPLT